jgi:hypothetical protein
MSKSNKFTPGPWSVGIAKSGIHNPLVKGADGRNILETGGFGQKLEENTANARLIAAAPDCLAALQLVLDDNRLMNSMSREQARAILDAVAKATGGAE